MAKSTNINNRRYLGNKYKLLPFIKKVVDSECTDIERCSGHSPLLFL